MHSKENISLPDTDSLKEMLTAQKEFRERVDMSFYDMTPLQRVQYIKEYSIHLNQEINEMLYELPFFKPWKDYSAMTEAEQNVAMEKARMEMIDAWCFFMNMCIMLDFTPESFYNMYLDKVTENHKRQDDGYTHDKSFRGGPR